MNTRRQMRSGCASVLCLCFEGRNHTKALKSTARFATVSIVARRTMKTFLPWLIALLALGSAYFFHASQRSKSAELAELKQGLVELDRLRAENEELKAGRVSSDELNRLRKNTEDLLRLRNEVRQLRDDKQQLSQQASAAQAQAEQARAQTQAAQAQAQAIQAQAQALATNGALSPEVLHAQQSFQQRYGLAMTPEQAQVNACLNQLRQLDGAKQQWALEKQKPVGTQPTWEDVAAYLKDGVLPACPAGGSHTLNAVGIAPTCSLPGHALLQ